jgi:hypothetical protein
VGVQLKVSPMWSSWREITRTELEATAIIKPTQTMSLDFADKPGKALN